MCALDSDGLREHGRTALRRATITGPTIVTSCGMHSFFGEIPRAHIAGSRTVASVYAFVRCHASGETPRWVLVMCWKVTDCFV